MSLPPPRAAVSSTIGDARSTASVAASTADTTASRTDEEQGQLQKSSNVNRISSKRMMALSTPPDRPESPASNISALISPYNVSFRSGSSPRHPTSSSAAPVPPFLASILTAHHASQTAASTPPSSSLHPVGTNGAPNASPVAGPSNANASASGNITAPITPQAPPTNPSAALYTLPPAPSPPEDPFIPPENFSLVASGVYRSGFPKKKNFRFMETLKLKTVLTLVLEDYPAASLKWCEEQDVQFMVGRLDDCKDRVIRTRAYNAAIRYTREQGTF